MKKPTIFPGLSLQKKIPLLICILLLFTISIFTYSSFEEVKKVSLSAGSTRLQALTNQIGSMFEQMGKQLLTATQKTAKDASIRAYLGSEKKDSIIQVKALLRKEQTDTLMPLVQIFDAKQILSLQAGDSIQFASLRDSIFPRASSGAPVATVGKIYGIGSKMFFPIITTISDGTKVLGYFIKWRRLITSPAEIDALSELMGAKSAFYVGNDDGGFWTNGMISISPPPIDLKDPKNIVHYNINETPVIASAKNVANTNWLVMITLSEEAITETANEFLYQMLVIGAILTFLCIIFAWLIGRSITLPLKKLTSSAEAIANGNYSHRLNIKRKDELGKLAFAFDSMSVKRKNYEEELRFSQEQLRQLAAHLQNIREEERIGIAREIHDVIGQLLTAIKFDVNWLKRKLKPVNNETDNKISGTLQLVDETIQATRKISSQLRPDILNDLGLIEALRWQANEFQNRTGIGCRFTTSVEQPEIETAVSFGLYRICQEALTNVARHSNATQVDISFERDNINRLYILKISDNGAGYDENTVKDKKRLGVVGMRERALSMNGEYTVNTATGKGVVITVKVPA